MNTKLIALPERAMDLAGKLGGEVMEFVPRAGQWLDAGVKIGAVKTGGRVAMKFVRRYPVVAVATVVGAGALWLLARKKAKQAQNGDGRDTIEGSARRVPAKRASGTKRTARKTTRASQTASE
jgi:hypothetical protein